MLWNSHCNWDSVLLLRVSVDLKGGLVLDEVGLMDLTLDFENLVEIVSH